MLQLTNFTLSFLRIAPKIQSSRLTQKMDAQGYLDQLEQKFLIERINYEQQACVQNFQQQPDEAVSLSEQQVNKSQEKGAPKQEECQQIDQEKLKSKLLNIFEKDRKKQKQICDRFMYGLNISQHCQNIRQLIDYIHGAGSKHWFLDGPKPLMTNKQQTHLTFSKNQQSDGRKQIPSLHSHLSSQLELITSFFSRDKLHTLLSLHSTHQKILKFLQSILISMQSYSYSIQHDWILTKDEVQRCFMRYVKNIQRMLRVEDIDIQEICKDSEHKELINDSKRPDLRNKQDRMSSHLRHARRQQQYQNTYRKGVLKKKRMLNTHKQNKEENRRCKNHLFFHIQPKPNRPSDQQIDLQQYKRDIFCIKDKIKSIQQKMSSQILGILKQAQQRFQPLLQKLKKQLEEICKWVRKAQGFAPSPDKDRIIKFLLVNRSKGLEALIFIQQIYRCIFVKLQQQRVKFDQQIEFINSKRKKLVRANQSCQRDPHLAPNHETSLVFKRFQGQLKIKVQKDNYKIKYNELRNLKDRSSQDSAQSCQIEQIFPVRCSIIKNTKPIQNLGMEFHCASFRSKQQNKPQAQSENIIHQQCLYNQISEPTKINNIKQSKQKKIKKKNKNIVLKHPTYLQSSFKVQAGEKIDCIQITQIKKKPKGKLYHIDQSLSEFQSNSPSLQFLRQNIKPQFNRKKLINTKSDLKLQKNYDFELINFMDVQMHSLVQKKQSNQNQDGILKPENILN